MSVNGFSSWNSFGNLWNILIHMDHLYDFLVDSGVTNLQKTRADGDTANESLIIQLPGMRITSSADPAIIEHVTKTNFQNYPSDP